MSWKAANLQPVIPMYTEQGAITAVFFATPTFQWNYPVGDWEPIPLIPKLMCMVYMRF